MEDEADVKTAVGTLDGGRGMRIATASCKDVEYQAKPCRIMVLAMRTLPRPAQVYRVLAVRTVKIIFNSAGEEIVIRRDK